MKQHCPKCGNLLNPRSKYCPKCGSDVSEIIKDNQNSIEIKSLKSSASKKSLKKGWLFAGLCLLLLIIILSFGAANYYQKSAQVKRINASLIDSKTDLSKYAMTTSKVKISAENLKPLQNYFSKNRALAKQVTQNKISSSKLKLVRNGRYFLIFPKYQLKIQAVGLTVKTSSKKAKLYLNQQKKTLTSNEAKFNLFPGDYALKAIYSVYGQKLVQKRQVILLTNRVANLEVPTVNLKIKSLPKANVYVDRQKVGTTSQKGVLNLPSYPLNKSQKLFLTKKINGKIVRSTFLTHLDIKKKNLTVSPTWPGMSNKKEINKLLKSAFTQNDVNDYLDGQKNEDYLAIQKMKKQFKADPDIKAVKYQVIKLSQANNKANYQVRYVIKQAGSTRVQVVKYTNAQVIKSQGQLKIVTIGSGKLVSDLQRD